MPPFYEAQLLNNLHSDTWNLFYILKFLDSF